MDGLLSYDKVAQVFAKKGYPFYRGKYNINLYGIRSKDTTVDQFNDILGVAYEDHFGNKINLVHKGTTKPGLYWLKTKVGNAEGTAILFPGHYGSCWVVGKHKGEYEALVQSDKSQFKVWRDKDSDGQLDYSGPLFTNVGGLNMHCESLLSATEKVGAYSAGCQVRQFDLEHFAVVNLAKLSTIYWGKYLSYTLFEEMDFNS